ncbi:heterogeneous nuclear ribonucleoprotein U-like protein 2, partial [Asbolus verrucosus]
MSSTLDPAKLKVVELRAELSKRGLDSKGNKPALVKRLKEALEQELKEELPDTSIADTSTEDLDISQTQEHTSSEECKLPDKDIKSADSQCKLPELERKVDEEIPEGALDTESAPKEEKMETEETQMLEEEVTKDAETELEKPQGSEKTVDAEEKEEVDSQLEESKENGDQDEPKSRKSRWSSEMDGVESKQNDEQPQENNQVKSTDAVKSDNDAEPKGEKRRRSSPSPDRSQRRRSKSPIKEDEPPIDNDKVQLNDSDLHLQLDKESFLSAKPYHEGAFGFAWAGVRATHGVNLGKVCFEVKITEELKWEDFSKYYDKHRRDQHKSFSKHKADDEKKKNEDEPKNKEDEKSKNDSEQTENGEKSEIQLENQSETMETGENEKPEDNKNDVIKTDKNVESKDEVMETDVNKEQNLEGKGQTESKEQPELLPTHLFRVGWSLLDTGLQLGEDKFSYGYESSGRFVTDKQFQDYGIKFGVGDVVASFLSIDEDGANITYSVNGVTQQEAVTIPKSEFPENFALFPHVLSRNYAFELNLGSKEESWFAKPDSFEDYEYLDKIQTKIAGPVRPENRSDCEVILMCGLPASGKTHWVREYIQSNPGKNYTLLGNTHLLEKMT